MKPPSSHAVRTQAWFIWSFSEQPGQRHQPVHLTLPFTQPVPTARATGRALTSQHRRKTQHITLRLIFRPTQTRSRLLAKPRTTLSIVLNSSILLKIRGALNHSSLTVGLQRKPAPETFRLGKESVAYRRAQGGHHLPSPLKNQG